MKTTRIVTILCWCVSALALISLAIWFIFFSPLAASNWGRLFNSNFSISISGETLTGPFNPVSTHNVAPDNIDSLNIDWISGTITIEPHTGNEIVITEFAQRDLNDNEKMYISTTGSTLNIQYVEGRRVGTMPSKRLEILIPETLSNYLNRLFIDTTSGLITITDLTSQTIDIRSTSGGITAANIYTESFIINGTSGNLNISDTNAYTIRTNITSGRQNISGTFNDVHITGTSGGLNLENYAEHSTLHVSITSGAQDISGSFRTADLRSTSGTVFFLSRTVPESVRVNNTSGNVTITVPNEGTISVNHSSTSGRFTSDVPVIMQSGDAQIRVSSTSGNLTINELR